MLKVDPKTLSKAKFVCSVLWMNGKLPTSEIAQRASQTVKKEVTPGQVRGYAHNLFEKPRQTMTLEERQAVLDVLNELRGPLGVMEYKMQDGWFQAADLVDRGGGRRKDTPDFDLSTKDGKKAAKRHEEAEQKKAGERAQGGATQRGVDASPLQYLFARNLLADREMSKSDQIATSKRRWNAAEQFSKNFEGSRLSAFGAMDYERASMGGGGGGGKLSLPAYKLMCMDWLNALHQMLTDAEFGLLEALVDRQEFIWDWGRRQSKERAEVYETIRYLLDVVSVLERWITRDDFKAKWSLDLPEPDIEPNRRASRALSAEMEEFVRATR